MATTAQTTPPRRLVPAGDADGLRARITELLADRPQRERLAAAGLEAVRTRFNQRRMRGAIGAGLRALV